MAMAMSRVMARSHSRPFASPTISREKIKVKVQHSRVKPASTHTRRKDTDAKMEEVAKPFSHQSGIDSVCGQNITHHNGDRTHDCGGDMLESRITEGGLPAGGPLFVSLHDSFQGTHVE
jgi:hypothetical protein